MRLFIFEISLHGRGTWESSTGVIPRPNSGSGPNPSRLAGFRVSAILCYPPRLQQQQQRRRDLRARAAAAPGSPDLQIP